MQHFIFSQSSHPSMSPRNHSLHWWMCRQVMWEQSGVYRRAAEASRLILLKMWSNRNYPSGRSHSTMQAVSPHFCSEMKKGVLRVIKMMTVYTPCKIFITCSHYLQADALLKSPFCLYSHFYWLTHTHTSISKLYLSNKHWLSHCSIYCSRVICDDVSHSKILYLSNSSRLMST